MATIWKRNDRDIWIVDYRDATGKRCREVAGTTREEAEQALAKVIQTATDTPLDVRDRDITVKEYGARWLESAQGDLASRTHRSYQQLFTRHIEPTLGRKKVRKLRRRDVRQFLTTKRQAGLGKNSIRLIKATMSTILAQAVEDELLQANPALGRFRGVRQPGVSVTEVNPMTQEQSQRLDLTLTRLQAENRLSPVYTTFFQLLHGTGLRPSEARALQPEHLDLTKGTLRVERSADLHGQIKTTKTEETRLVDLSARLRTRLQDYLGWLTLETMANQAQSDRLFPGDAHGLLDESQVRKVFKWILRQAELPHFRVYDLRHSYASALLSAGVPLLYVSKQLGHRKPTTTLKYYAKWIPSEDRRYVDVLDTGLELGTKPWHQVDVNEKEGTEVVEKFGGPCRGRTYGPLIKRANRPFFTRVRCCNGFPVYP